MATIPTSPAKTYKPRPNSRGFTLIETLVTLGIIAFVVAIGIPRIGRMLGTQIRSTARKIVTLNKELHAFSRVKNKTYRLVISFGDSDHKPSLTVESSTSKQLQAPPDATPPPSSIKSFDDDEEKDPFSSDTELLKKPITLPKGVSFEDVETDSQSKPITEGKAYVIFFPEGRVTRAIIHLTDGKNLHWSLIVNPLTGLTDIQTEYVKLKELDEK